MCVGRANSTNLILQIFVENVLCVGKNSTNFQQNSTNILQLVFVAISCKCFKITYLSFLFDQSNMKKDSQEELKEKFVING